MRLHSSLTRRSFVGAAASAVSLLEAKRKGIPVGLELFSVREQLSKDLFGTVRAVAKMGYEGVEFYSPYYQWTTAYAKDVRKLLDDLGIRCFSTHNSGSSFDADKIGKAIELNQIIGSKFIVMASAGKVETLDGWKAVAERLNQGAEKMKPAGMRAGFHNHLAEFQPLEGTRPMEVLAKHTGKDVVLQLDTGPCLEAGVDPVDWIRRNPGRIVSMHCKDWSRDPAKTFTVLLGEGETPWKKVFQAAEKVGGIEYYLVEQEGSAYSPFETAEKCLAAFRRLHG